MSSEDLECDLPSWSCQTGPQPDPRPLRRKLRRATGHGALGRAAPRSPSEASRARSKCFSQSPRHLCQPMSTSSLLQLAGRKG